MAIKGEMRIVLDRGKKIGIEGERDAGGQGLYQKGRVWREKERGGFVKSEVRAGRSEQGREMLLEGGIWGGSRKERRRNAGK